MIGHTNVSRTFTHKSDKPTINTSAKLNRQEPRHRSKQPKGTPKQSQRQLGGTPKTHQGTQRDIVQKGLFILQILINVVLHMAELEYPALVSLSSKLNIETRLTCRHLQRKVKQTTEIKSWNLIPDRASNSPRPGFVLIKLVNRAGWFFAYINHLLFSINLTSCAAVPSLWGGVHTP